MRLVVLLLSVAVLLPGCITEGSIKALAASGRSWCISVTSVYGTARAGGTGIAGGRAICNQEGMNVTATPGGAE